MKPKKEEKSQGQYNREMRALLKERLQKRKEELQKREEEEDKPYPLNVLPRKAVKEILLYSIIIPVIGVLIFLLVVYLIKLF